MPNPITIALAVHPTIPRVNAVMLTPQASIHKPPTMGFFLPTRSASNPVIGWARPHTIAYTPATQPVATTVSPLSRKKTGSSDQIRVSAILLATPAWQSALNVGSPTDTRKQIWARSEDHTS